MGLARYHRKRDFARTPEPRGRPRRAPAREAVFVVHEHDATRLHYDLRLELDGVLKSWAVPKGPSLDPAQRRLAVHVEDHPLEYATFEGVIPEGQYGGGPVILWDRGTWSPHGDPREAYRAGRLAFDLHGEKLHGSWALVRMRPRNGDDRHWLLIKSRDRAAREGATAAVTRRLARSVVSGRRVGDLVERGRGADRGGRRAASPPPPLRRRATRSRHRTETPDRGDGARRAPIPPRLSCALATLVKEAPAGDAWLHEIKFDGYRILCRIEDGRARLVSRNGKDWTHRFPGVAEAAADLPARSAWLDGEVVWVEPDGTTSFQALQRMGEDQARGRLRYYVFDLPYLDGRDLTRQPLLARKEALQGLLEGGRDPLAYSAHVRGRGPRFLSEACRRGLEGIVSKRADAPYRGRRTRDWLKVRCGARQEMVLGGYVVHSADPKGVGALLLGTHDEAGRLRYAGRVGTGFTTASRRDLKRRLDARARSTSPFDGPVDARGDVRFVAPDLVGEVAFTEWTADGRLRHPSFLGLREDKRARDVVREDAGRAPAAGATRRRAKDGGSRAVEPRDSARATRPAAEAAVLGVRLTNPDKPLWPAMGVTKADLAAYYEAVADRMLPLVVGRPLMLLRCPDGRHGDCFHQKQMDGPPPGGIRVVPIVVRGARRAYGAIESAQGLVSLAQMGVLEVHVWGSRVDRLERPDRIVFDLDPAPDLAFTDVVAAARDLRDRLEALGLRSFAATTGGKGLHVHVPIARVHGWEDVREFARRFAYTLAEEEPARFVATASKARRRGRIFVDWLRNVRGATAVAPYSPRAVEGAPVATPLAWDEVTARLRPDRFTIETVPSRVARGADDPWRGLAAAAGRLGPALERTGTTTRGGRASRGRGRRRPTA